MASAVVGAAHLAGAQCRVGAWLPLALEAVAAPKLTDASRANALVILSALLYGSGEATELLRHPPPPLRLSWVGQALPSQ